MTIDSATIEKVRDALQGFVTYFEKDEFLDNGLEEIFANAKVVLEETEDF